MNEAELIRIAAPRPAPDAGAWRPKLELLRAELARLGSVVVAYSGGVDSSVLLRAAHEVLGPRAMGVIGRSDSYAASELTLALEQAVSFGARVEVVTTGELSDPNFSANPSTRCYFCKSELYRQLQRVAAREGAAAILDGTIRDDLGDWRPGRRAAEQGGVRSPLAEIGFCKSDVRAVAEHFGLPSRDKPASPCLASRIPYGSEITREKLRMVEEAEAYLRSQGFVELRVRHHGEVARIELPVADLPRLIQAGRLEEVVRALKLLGFVYVTVDLEGFRSGSLNALLGVSVGASDGAK